MMIVNAILTGVGFGLGISIWQAIVATYKKAVAK